MKKLIAIAVIWFGCAFAWMILGANLVSRTDGGTHVLSQEVIELWGPEILQLPPSIEVAVPEPAKRVQHRADPEGSQDVTVLPDPRVVQEQVAVAVPATVEKPQLDLSQSHIKVALDHEHRKKGLLWFSTYKVGFDAEYGFTNPSDKQMKTRIYFPTNREAIYDGLGVARLDGAQAADVDVQVQAGGLSWEATFAPGETQRFRVHYGSRGVKSFSYKLSRNGEELRDFELSATSSTPGVDFAAGSVSPTTHESTGSTWAGVWTFDHLVTSKAVSVVLPTPMNPGPVASRITFFAPVSLLFFFFVVAVLTAAKQKSIHPMNYLLLGCAFFAFHLLFAYAVDHVSIAAAFGLASVVSVVLVASYARLFVGWRFALTSVTVPQIIYLVLFSLSFFWQGFTGLSVAVGAIITLFVVMQITGKVDWTKMFAVPPRPNSPPNSPVYGAQPPPYGVAPSVAAAAKTG